MENPQHKKHHRIIWIGTAVIVAMAVVMAIEALSTNVSANIDRTYLSNGSVGMSICDNTTTHIGLGVDVCTNTSIYTQTVYIAGEFNSSGAGYIANSPICTAANGYCAGASGVACTALGNDYVLSNTTAPTCIRIIRYDNPTICAGGEYSTWNGSNFLCATDSGGSGSGNASANNSINNIPVHTGGGNLTQSSLNFISTRLGVNNTSPNATLDITGTLIVRPGPNQNIQLNDGGSANSIWGINGGMIGTGGWQYLTSRANGIRLTTGATLNSLSTGTIRAEINGTNGYFCLNCTAPNSVLTISGNQSINSNAASGGGISIFNTNAGRTQSFSVHRPGVGGIFATTSGGTPAGSVLGSLDSTYAQFQNIFFSSAASENLAKGDIQIGSGLTTTQPTMFIAINRTQVGINNTQPNATLHVIGTINASNGIQSDNFSGRVYCIGNDCRTSWPTSGGGSGSGNVTATISDKWIPYAYNTTEIANSPVFYDTQINGLNFSRSNLTLGGIGKIFTSALVCNDFGNCPYIGQSPSFNERLYFYTPDFIELEADGVLLPRQYNEFRSYNAAETILNITNTGGGNGSLSVQNTTYTQALCLSGNCRTSWPSGGSFTYSQYFDQTLNTTSNVQFNTVNAQIINNTNVTYKNNYVEPYAFQTQNFKCFESELGGTATAPNNAMNTPFYVQTISAGSVVGTTSGGNNHSLITTLRDSTTINGGALIGMSQVNAGEFTPQSGDEYRAIVRFINGKTVLVTTRIGFMDTQSVADATDGCHILFNSSVNTATARCRAGGATTSNATTYTYSNSTWYGVSVAHPTSSTANFTIWSDTGSVLWNVGLTSGINTAVSNPQLISTQNTTDTASDLIDVDYVGFCRKYKPQRAWSYGQ